MTATQPALSGKSVVITGAGRGLGEQYALQAAAAGAKVVVNDVDVAQAQVVVDAIVAAGGEAIASGHSIATAEGALELVALCVDTFGSLDGFVANAGLFYEETFPGEGDLAAEFSLISVNVAGALASGAAAIAQMVRQNHGSLVMIVSGSAIGMPGLAAYGSSKGAVTTLTYSWAAELFDANYSDIRVNAVSPVASTRMISTRMSTEGFPPDRVAPVVLWLLSDLSKGVTGQVVRFNGFDLCLIQPPQRAEPMVTIDEPSIAAIDDAFRSQIGDNLQPFGLVQRTAAMDRSGR